MCAASLALSCNETPLCKSICILSCFQATIEQLRQDLAKRTQTILSLNADCELAQQVGLIMNFFSCLETWEQVQAGRKAHFTHRLAQADRYLLVCLEEQVKTVRKAQPAGMLARPVLFGLGAGRDVGADSSSQQVCFHMHSFVWG